MTFLGSVANPNIYASFTCGCKLQLQTNWVGYVSTKVFIVDNSMPYLVGGFNPFENYEPNWIISQNRVENKRSFKRPPSLLTNTWGCAESKPQSCNQPADDKKTPLGSATVCNLCCPLTRTWHHRSTGAYMAYNVAIATSKYHNLHKWNHIEYWWVLLGPQIPSRKPHIERCVAKVFHLNPSLHHSPVTFSTSGFP